MSIKGILQGRGLGHPIHAALVHLPVGLFFGSLIFDIVSMAQNDPNAGNFFNQVSWYCVLIGVIAALPIAVTGLAEFVDIPSNTKVQRVALTHMILNVLIVAAYVVQLFVRERAASTVSAGVFIYNVVLILLLSYSGYLGGLLAYRYAVGTRTPLNPQGSANATDQQRLRRVA